MPVERKVVVPENLEGERLDKALKELVPDISRRKMRTLIEKGAVYLNEKRCAKLSKMVKTGDKVKIVENDDDADPVSEPVIQLQIIYDEGGLLAVNKPPLLASVPTQTGLRSAQHSAALFKNLKLKDIHPVNRLDLPVSGVLLFTVDIEATKKLEELKAGNLIKKSYLTWVKGELKEKEGMISYPLSARKGTAYVDSQGKESTTLYKVMKITSGFSLLEVNPQTGRMHQIRVHLKEIGFPIVGDRKYGSAPFLGKRPLLHCSSVSFPSFENDKTITIEAPLPGDFDEFQNLIENNGI
jgi:23S rRNA pseudouridine1911/1915/1917 synthase